MSDRLLYQKSKVRARPSVRPRALEATHENQPRAADPLGIRAPVTSRVEARGSSPSAADAGGKDFTSTVDDAATVTAAQSTTEGSADSDASDGNIWTVTTTDYAVAVTPDTTAVSRLPSNGTNYTVDFTVANGGGATDDYDLLTTQSPGTAVTVVSITGTGVTQGSNPDSARGVRAGSLE